MNLTLLKSLRVFWFKKYNSIESLANADVLDIENIIKPIGTYHVKARNVILIAKQLKQNTDKPYIYMGVIKKYIRKINSCRLDKEDQSKLCKQLYAINKGSITLVSVLKYLGLSYSYVNNDKFGTWKDIIIFPSKTIKKEYDLGLIQEKDFLFEWMPKKYTKNA